MVTYLDELVEKTLKPNGSHYSRCTIVFDHPEGQGTLNSIVGCRRETTTNIESEKTL